MVNLNGHEAGNCGNSQGDTYGNLPFLGSTLMTNEDEVFLFPMSYLVVKGILCTCQLPVFDPVRLAGI
ncbi:MAG: hypothetical protein AAB013_01290 [Planctomycetota bacterium]